MATSTCPKCPNTTFEIKELAPRGSNYKLMAVQCSSCGCVISVQDYFHVPTLLERIAKKMGFDIHRAI